MAKFYFRRQHGRYTVVPGSSSEGGKCLNVGKICPLEIDCGYRENSALSH